MAMHFYGNTSLTNVSGFACNGCGAVMAYYSSPAALGYGI